MYAEISCLCQHTGSDPIPKFIVFPTGWFFVHKLFSSSDINICCQGYTICKNLIDDINKWRQQNESRIYEDILQKAV